MTSNSTLDTKELRRVISNLIFLINFSNVLSKVKYKPKSVLEINFQNYRHSEKNS